MCHLCHDDNAIILLSLTGTQSDPGHFTRMWMDSWLALGVEYVLNIFFTSTYAQRPFKPGLSLKLFFIQFKVQCTPLLLYHGIVFRIILMDVLVNGGSALTHVNIFYKFHTSQ